MAAHGKHVGAVWVEPSHDLVELVYRSHWLLINFFDDIPALQFREVRGINYNSVNARRQIKTFGQIGFNSLTRMESNGFVLFSS